MQSYPTVSALAAESVCATGTRKMLKFVSKKPFAVVLVLSVLVVATADGAEQPVNLCVATNGNDAWSGALGTPNADSTDGPFASLTRARDEIRKRKAGGELSGPVTVYVRAGVYSLPETFKLDGQDSGTAETPVTYRAYQGETVVITGGKPVTGFASHRGKVLVADVAGQGLQGVKFRQLFCSGKRQPLARYPNFDAENPYGGGWAYADGKPVPMYAEVPGEDKHSLQFKESDAREWANPQDGEVFVFPRYNWWNNLVRIKSIDREARKITLTGDCSYPIRPTDRYYVQGMFEELDAPGEWYLDQSAGKLYFWPPEGVRPGACDGLRPGAEDHSGTDRDEARDVSADSRSSVVRAMRSCSETPTTVLLPATRSEVWATTAVRGSTFTMGRTTALRGTTSTTLAGVPFRSAAGIARPSRLAIIMRTTTTFTTRGVYYKQGVGISLQGCGNRASHNLIHDCPRFGIGFGGNNLVIEYNHIRHVNLETADTGAIYTGGR